jgi:YHS domain-containing protein
VKEMSAAFKNLRGIVITGLFLTVVFLQTNALAEQAPRAEDISEENTSVKSVNPDVVCMTNDRILWTPQIPVQVEGKTYYGCCEGCVKSLQSNRSVRFAKDPFTGDEVDKAKAFIVEGPKGKALYFESPETAQKYLASEGTGGER